MARRQTLYLEPEIDDIVDERSHGFVRHVLTRCHNHAYVTFRVLVRSTAFMARVAGVDKAALFERVDAAWECIDARPDWAAKADRMRTLLAGNA